jgi:hypothetical protein
MTKYLADSHGNWLEIVEGETELIYLLDTDTLSVEQQKIFTDLIHNDGAEDYIKAYGERVNVLDLY